MSHEGHVTFSFGVTQQPHIKGHHAAIVRSAVGSLVFLDTSLLFPEAMSCTGKIAGSHRFPSPDQFAHRGQQSQLWIVWERLFLTSQSANPLDLVVARLENTRIFFLHQTLVACPAGKHSHQEVPAMQISYIHIVMQGVGHASREACGMSVLTSFVRKKR